MKNKIIVASIASLFLVLSFLKTPTQKTLEFLESSTSKIVESTLVINELQLVANAGATSDIPILSGIALDVKTTLNKMATYLDYSTAILIGQTLLVKLSRSVLFNAIAILSIIGLFFTKTNSLSSKVLALCLFISPGISLYTLGIQSLKSEIKIDLGNTLCEELHSVKNKYNIELSQQKKEEKQTEHQQLLEAEKRGEKHINFFLKIENDIHNFSKKAKLKVDESYHLSILVIKKSSAKLMKLMLHTFVAIVLLFLLLPLGYVYLLKLLIQNIIFTKIAINENN